MKLYRVVAAIIISVVICIIILCSCNTEVRGDETAATGGSACLCAVTQEGSIFTEE